MERVTPRYPREVVNRAGRALLENANEEVPLDDETLEIIGNWRAAHSFPLNTMKLWLLKKSQLVDKGSLVAQRLKRLSSIAAKLQRYPEMRLTQMQDLGGCRAILTSVEQVNRLRMLYKQSEIRHELVHQDDYIACPKDSGYRGIHLVYRYESDRSSTFNGLKIEVQLRSRLQHAWATSVETVGTFSQQALKSSQGQEEWLRFFALMGSAIALRENTSLVPGTPITNRQLQDEIRELAQRLDVIKRLKLYTASLKIPERAGSAKAKYFLLELAPSEMRIRITGYQASELEKAQGDYLTAERRVIPAQSGMDAVLVSVDSISALKRAYPNYFFDTDYFMNTVEDILRSRGPRRSNPLQMSLPFPSESLAV